MTHQRADEQPTAPGWYEDAEWPGQRYWDGSAWGNRFDDQSAGEEIARQKFLGLVIGGRIVWLSLGVIVLVAMMRLTALG